MYSIYSLFLSKILFSRLYSLIQEHIFKTLWHDESRQFWLWKSPVWMHLCFPILWQLGRPVNHAFELNANSIYLSKTHASISLATAEPFQSLDLDHIIPIFFWERHIPHFKFGWEMQDVEDPELREALALSMSPLDGGEGRSVNPDWVWRSKCNRLHLTVVEVISEFELLCSVVTLMLVHSWFFRLFRRIGFLAEFWVNSNGWLRRPWSGAANGFAQTILWGGVQLYVTDFVSGPTCSQAPRRAPLWGPFSVPVLAVPGGAQLVTFNRPIWAISRSQRDLGWSWKRSAPASCKTI